MTLSGPSVYDTQVSYQTENGNGSSGCWNAVAGVNYVASSGEVDISAGMTSAWIPVSTIDDGIFEPSEAYFSVQMNSVSGGANLRFAVRGHRRRSRTSTRSSSCASPAPVR